MKRRGGESGASREMSANRQAHIQREEERHESKGYKKSGWKIEQIREREREIIDRTRERKENRKKRAETK